MWHCAAETGISSCLFTDSRSVGFAKKKQSKGWLNMLWLCENFAPIAVAASASVVAWMYGGACGDVLVPVVPWVFALLLEVFLVFPQRHHGETSFEARSRNWRHLGRSAVFWTALGLLVLLLIPFVNNGLCPGCDAALIAQGVNPAPRVSFLPFCVNRFDHLSVVLGIAMAIELAVVVFFGLTREGKRLALELIVWNGVAMAAFGFIQAVLDAPGPFWNLPEGGASGGHGAFFSVFGYPNMAGDYFTLLFGLSVALWRDHSEKARLAEKSADSSELAAMATRRIERLLRRHYLLIPAVICFFAALYTLSRAAIILATSTAFVYFVHTLWILLSRMKKSRRIIIGVWSTLAFGIVAFFSTIFMPNDIKKEVDTLDSIEMLDRVTGRGQYHTTVATAIWSDHKLFGCGGWGYKHFCVPKMKELKMNVKRSLQMQGGANVHNDYLQFLAEHGLVGFGAMVLLAILLYIPVACQWAQSVKDLRFKKEAAKMPKPLEIFALPAPAFIVTVAVIATLIHAFGDCPLRSSAVLSLVYISIAAIGGFMPHSHPDHK